MQISFCVSLPLCTRHQLPLPSNGTTPLEAYGQMQESNLRFYKKPPLSACWRRKNDEKLYPRETGKTTRGMPYGKILSYIVLADKIFIPVSTMTFCWFMPSLLAAFMSQLPHNHVLAENLKAPILTMTILGIFGIKHEKTLKV